MIFFFGHVLISEEAVQLIKQIFLASSLWVGFLRRFVLNAVSLATWLHIVYVKEDWVFFRHICLPEWESIAVRHVRESIAEKRHQYSIPVLIVMLCFLLLHIPFLVVPELLGFTFCAQAFNSDFLTSFCPFIDSHPDKVRRIGVV